MEDDILDLLYNIGLDNQFQRLVVADNGEKTIAAEKVEEPPVIQKEKPKTSAR